MKTFKTLYRQASTGRVVQWTISVKKNEVITEYGLVDGKLQTTTDIVKEGKNIGRSNETTPEGQALLQAEQNFEAKLKEGYVEDKKLAASTKNTLDAVEPMLAHPIEKKEKYVTYPALAQPKLDGLRCIAIMKKGKVKLFSRTQKEYTTLPHLVEEIERQFKDYPDIILDGELYNHKLKKDFNKITSVIKRDEIHENHTIIQYHIYDVVAPGDYPTRIQPLAYSLEGSKYLLRVETVPISSRDELEQYQANCVERGYEGCMYRSIEGLYEHKRSPYLLKVKTFQDAEYLIVDVEEGKGKLMGRVGAFYCELNDGSKRRFKASPAVDLETKKEMWENHKTYIGKWATIKYQNLTPDNCPRFPIFKAVRDE